MRNPPKTVRGITALAPRLTPFGAAVVALVVALLVGAVLTIVDWLI